MTDGRAKNVLRFWTNFICRGSDYIYNTRICPYRQRV